MKPTQHREPNTANIFSQNKHSLMEPTQPFHNYHSPMKTVQMSQYRAPLQHIKHSPIRVNTAPCIHQQHTATCEVSTWFLRQGPKIRVTFPLIGLDPWDSLIPPPGEREDAALRSTACLLVTMITVNLPPSQPASQSGNFNPVIQLHI
ncbi:hypothetical protein E2C01_044394 [Portunus trituberculatus]|uniref:Uncharacterized protein n=1 Tax=Portunus trituberculatus TaxID=210409 RepID=A0A5B7FZ42_PORTR|nr:hypothetical protein [Portunus trituberculatus]